MHCNWSQYNSVKQVNNTASSVQWGLTVFYQWTRGYDVLCTFTNLKRNKGFYTCNATMISTYIYMKVEEIEKNKLCALFGILNRIWESICFIQTSHLLNSTHHRCRWWRSIQRRRWLRMRKGERTNPSGWRCRCLPVYKKRRTYVTRDHQPARGFGEFHVSSIVIFLFNLKENKNAFH